MNWRHRVLMAAAALLLVALGAFVVGPFLQGEGGEYLPFVDAPGGDSPGARSEGDPVPSPDRRGGTPRGGPAEGAAGFAVPGAAQDAEDLEAGAPERISIMSEVPDTVPAGVELRTPITVRVGDENNLPVPEADVVFSVREGDGRLERPEAETDEVGTARLRYTPESEGRHLLEVRLQAAGDTGLASFHAVREP